MRLTWHIIKKDLRRMALPVGLWVLFIVATGWWMGHVRVPEGATGIESEHSGFHPPDRWLNGLASFAHLSFLLQQVGAVLLTGFLVLEDAPAGTRVFWPTRPIAGARLLAAKLIAALLLFAVAPVAGLTAVWIGDGFTGQEVVRAALTFSGLQLLVVWFALAVAVLADSFARFVLMALGVMVGVSLIVQPMFWRWMERVSGGVGHTRLQVFGIVIVIATLWIVGRQYLTSRKSLWIALPVTLVLMLLVRLTWAWDWQLWLPWSTEMVFKDYPRVGLAGDEALQIIPDKIRVGWEPQRNALQLRMQSTVPQEKGIFLMPIKGVLGIGSYMQPIVPGPHWGEAAAFKVAGYTPESKTEWEDTAVRYDYGKDNWVMTVGPAPEPRADTWQMYPPYNLLFEESALRASTIQVSRGTCGVGVMSGRVLWRLPLHKGAEVKAGASWARLLDFDGSTAMREPDTEDRLVMVQERDANRGGADDAVNSVMKDVERFDEAVIDRYLVVDRTRNWATFAPMAEFGSVAANGIQVSVRQLVLTLPRKKATGDWRPGIEIVKVRFERERAFRCPIGSAEVSITREGKP